MPTPTTPDLGPRQLLKEVIFNELVNAIVDGTFHAGEHLSDAEIARWLGASRTPVRAAFAELTALGLCQTEPQRYTRVSPVTAASIHDSIEFAVDLAALSLGRWVGAASRADREQLARRFERKASLWSGTTGDAVASVLGRTADVTTNEILAGKIRDTILVVRFQLRGVDDDLLSGPVRALFGGFAEAIRLQAAEDIRAAADAFLGSLDDALSEVADETRGLAA